MVLVESTGERNALALLQDDESGCGAPAGNSSPTSLQSRFQREATPQAPMGTAGKAGRRPARGRHVPANRRASAPAAAHTERAGRAGRCGGPARRPHTAARCAVHRSPATRHPDPSARGRNPKPRGSRFRGRRLPGATGASSHVTCERGRGGAGRQRACAARAGSLRLGCGRELRAVNSRCLPGPQPAPRCPLLGERPPCFCRCPSGCRASWGGGREKLFPVSLRGRHRRTVRALGTEARTRA
ncbi:unnamed protein product [Rangifer tarandus platyrhynchus]|uniref:Uncharacterized protein n=1 Tax=Rangifer tarandus platyrhynchus TaxID=3082113 RepID=A0ABN8YEV2_RANTA|nr:unnamed protein product [Rangifer tarandus platyrhynchus]